MICYLAAIFVLVWALEPAGARAATITEYPIPAGVVDPLEMAFPRDGSVWFTGGKHQLVRFSRRTATFEVFRTTYRRTSELVLLPGGRLVMSQFQSVRGAAALTIVDTKRRTLRNVATAGWVSNLVAGGDGAVWGTRAGEPTDEESSLLLRLDSVTGRLTELDAGGYVEAMTVARDGALWYWRSNDPARLSLVRFDPLTRRGRVVVSRSRAEEDLLGGNMAFGRRGELYYSQFARRSEGGERIEAVNPRKKAVRTVLRERDLTASAQVAGARPDFFTIDRGGALWLPATSRMVRYEPRTRRLTDYPAPSAYGSLSGPVKGPKREIWFSGGRNLGRIQPTGNMTVGNLDTVLQRGFSTVAVCRRACLATAALVQGGTGVSDANPSQGTVLARAKKRVKAGGHRNLRLRFSQQARRALAGRRRIGLTLVTRVRSNRGRVHTYRRSVVLRKLTHRVRR